MVVASQDSNSPVARVSIQFKAGSRNETYENLGASHVLRFAAGLTTANATAFGITRNLQQVGSGLTVTGDREVVSYTVEVTKDNLETGLKYLEAAVTGQLFKPWELQDNLPRLRCELAAVPSQVKVRNYMP
jgi:ubiquinol-cytochrome c reductase core subunit 2